ncbi:hypothetical protein BAP_3858 [Bacillus sp. CN2]|nr:hypothetical protein EFW57_00885 [Bacillus velezensis]GFR57152.1 hypothetical protein BAP_3858 [Bacillus sp. CN2]
MIFLNFSAPVRRLLYEKGPLCILAVAGRKKKSMICGYHGFFSFFI